ncbi:MAG: hypothetical protein QOF68_2441 [Gaiellales bacterium]|nr:hypothetical protein [Gaiellales bacterium]
MMQLFDEYRTLQPTEDEVTTVLRRTAPRRLRVSRRWLLAPVAIAAIVFMAAASIGLPGGSGGRDARAAEILDGAAAFAAKQPDLWDLKDGQYLYSKSAQTNITGYADADAGYELLVTTTSEEWWGKDNWRRSTVTDDWQFRTPQDRQKWIDAGRPAINERADDFTETTDNAWRNYPTSADALYNVLADESAPDETAKTGVPQKVEMFVRVKDILRDPTASSELRAAALQVAQRIPGAEVAGEATDPLGRHGIIVAFPSDYWGDVSDQFLFDPNTYKALAERRLRSDSPPAEQAWNVFPDREVVSSITARP